MLDQRFEGEKNLAKKLEEFEYGETLGALPKFEAVDNQSSEKSIFWTGFKILFILFVLGALLFLMSENNSDLNSNEHRNKRVNKIDDKGQGTIGVEKVLFKESTSLNIEKETKGNTEPQLDINRPNTIIINNKTHYLKENKGGTKEKINVRLRSQTFDASEVSEFEGGTLEFKSKNEVQLKNLDSGDGNNNRIEVGDTEDLSTNRTLENCMALYSEIPFLEMNKTIFDQLFIETEPIVVEKKSTRSRISFGMQYNTGKTHAGAHETPFVSPFPTRIEGGKSFGYGFFGQINLGRRNIIRPSFTYSKNTHLQFVDSLRFQTGPTGINLELYSQELKFGLDYAFNFLPNIMYVDLKAGAGLAYHKIISLESNNYYTEAPEIISNANELDLSPLSYKLFLALDIPIYRGIVFGMEPYIIYQNRTARYTPSTIIADQGDHNLISGINLTLRF